MRTCFDSTEITSRQRCIFCSPKSLFMHRSARSLIPGSSGKSIHICAYNTQFLSLDWIVQSAQKHFILVPLFNGSLSAASTRTVKRRRVRMRTSRMHAYFVEERKKLQNINPCVRMKGCNTHVNRLHTLLPPNGHFFRHFNFMQRKLCSTCLNMNMNSKSCVSFQNDRTTVETIVHTHSPHSIRISCPDDILATDVIIICRCHLKSSYFSSRISFCEEKSDLNLTPNIQWPDYFEIRRLDAYRAYTREFSSVDHKSLVNVIARNGKKELKIILVRFVVGETIGPLQLWP